MVVVSGESIGEYGLNGVTFMIGLIINGGIASGF
jgi:hypothetical protein